MKKHHSYSTDEAHVDTIVVRKDGSEIPSKDSKESKDKDTKDKDNRDDKGSGKKRAAKSDTKSGKKDGKGKKKKKFHIYVAVLIVWLTAVTWVIGYYYNKFNDFQIAYEASYQASLPDLVIEDVFTHFEQRDIEYIWANMSEHPTVSQYEDEQTIKDYMLDMIEGKQLTYVESGEYTAEKPSYTVEADGYVIGSITLRKDPTQQREYGFPTYVLADISFPSLPLEGATITIPENFTVSINGIQLDDTYVTEEIPADEDLFQYVEPYGGTIPGFKTYAVSGLYYEPEVTVTDLFGNEVVPDYNESTDIYSTGYTSEHPERAELEEFGINFTTTFANVISRDANIAELDPYFPPDSLALDYISRSTALRYFTAHGSVTIENTEVQEFITYTEDTVYMEVYLEQWMQLGWGGSDPEVVPTTGHIFCVKIDGEWQVSGIRY